MGRGVDGSRRFHYVEFTIHSGKYLIGQEFDGSSRDNEMSKNEAFYRYLAIGPRDKLWGLFVTGAGYRDMLSGSPYPPNSHDHPVSHEYRAQKGRRFHEYALVYVSSGTGEFESEITTRTSLGAGTAFLLFPEVWHRYRPGKKTGWREYWVTFDGDQARELQKKGFIAPESPVIKTGLDDGILRSFKAILDHLRAEPLGFQQIIAAEVLKIIAAVLAADQRQRIGVHGYELIRRAKTAMEERGDGTPVIEDVAAALGVSASQLRRVFKEHAGVSPYQYHLQVKIGRARLMLRETDLPIKQIAKILGFRSAYHFSKLFKNRTAISPSQWRKGNAALTDPNSSTLIE
jgi:AraC-like DNA-binding protein